jgi:hypothetical protein
MKCDANGSNTCIGNDVTIIKRNLLTPKVAPLILQTCKPAMP